MAPQDELQLMASATIDALLVWVDIQDLGRLSGILMIMNILPQAELSLQQQSYTDSHILG